MREEADSGRGAHPAHTKVTREDWLNVARDILVSDGVERVKVLTIGTLLGVSRSSFYWYFKSRADLLEALLDDWEARNSAVILARCEAEAESIGAAVCNFFLCFVDEALFDKGLDFAVREWSRRDGAVRLRIDAADKRRLAAVEGMFVRFGYEPGEAAMRAKVLYFMQLGYHALEIRETMEERMAQVEGYLFGFTGQRAAPEQVAAFRARCLALKHG